MPRIFEQEVRRLFSETSNIERIKLDLEKFYESIIHPQNIFTESPLPKLNDHDKIELQRSFLNFLLSSGQTYDLMEWIFKEFENSEDKIPCDILAEAVARNLGYFPYEVAELIVNISKQNGSFLSLIGTQTLDTFEPDIKLERSQQRNRMTQNLEQQKQKWLQELEVLHTQRLIEQEAKLMSKLECVYPADADIERHRQSADELQAFEVLSKHGISSRLRLNKRGLDFKDSEDDLSAKTSMYQKLLTLAGAHPEWTYDICIAAHTMQLDELALELIEQVEEFAAKDWLKAECFLSSKKYLLLLDYLPGLEKKYATDPECFYACTYLRAQAFFGLGQKNLAMQAISSILQSRPNYRAVEILMKVWSEP